MIYNTGKTPATTQLQDGTLIQLFNADANIIDPQLRGEIVFRDVVGNSRYIVTIPAQAIQNHYRIACFTRSLPKSAHDNIVRMALLVNDMRITSQYNIPADVLYQMISPDISRTGFDAYQLTWWCNTDQAAAWKSTKNIDNITIGYNRSYIKKFNGNKILDEQPTANSGKVLCTANLKWEKLATTITFGNKIKDIVPKFYPIITNVTVLTIISGMGYITDFAAPGEGGSTAYKSINIHAHTAINDGGFAAAVFMPSAVMKPLNWS